MTIIKLSNFVNLRPQQIPLFEAFFKRRIRNFLRIAHRRFGKDFEAFNLTWCAAIERRGIYLYFLPTIGQSRRVVWDTIGEDGRRLIERIPRIFEPRFNGSEQTIKLPNGSVIYITGSDNYKRMIGLNACGIVWSEYQDTNPAAVDAMRPMITRNQGWQLFIGTPRAYNHMGEMYNQQKDNPEWLVTNLTINDTCDADGYPLITQADIDAERRNGMPEQIILQEYYGSFDAAIRGAYYGECLSDARKEGRIGLYPVDNQYPVYTTWDLGYDDSTSIWFFQHYKEKLYMIDYYENREKKISFYCDILKQKQKEWQCRYSTHWAPHDIENHELIAGKSRKDEAREHGFIFRTVKAPAKKLHGISCVRYIFPRLCFNESACRLGLKHLSEYRSSFNEKDGQHSSNPKHNEASHGADSLQTMALGWLKAFEETAFNKQREIANAYGSLIW